MHFTRGSVHIAGPSVGPSPGTTLRTPGGNPALSKISAIFRPTRDVSSEGFNTNVFPAARANATFLVARIRGKLNGAIPATTPSGLRIAIDILPGTSLGIVYPRMRLHSPAAER